MSATDRRSDHSAWVVHKFGGSSVADARCFERVATIAETPSLLSASRSHAVPARVAVVLSACKGVTDELLQLVALAERQDQSWRARLADVRDRHAGIASELLEPKVAAEYLAEFDRDCADLTGVLQTTSLMRSAAQSVSDLAAGFGEIWSTRLFHRYLRQRGVRQGVQWIDARRCVTVEWGPLGPGVQWQRSRAQLEALLGADAGRSQSATLVITGFIATDPRGVQTTLGRNGSDFSASIFGALLDAAEIHIWTDVDGVLSADPRRVPDAQVIDSLSYNEAMELAYFGAKVIHPQTMAPAVGRDIPIWIRNTFAPHKHGTLICAAPRSSLPVKGITSIENVALVNLEGAGMIGVPGTAHRLFGALREEGISVILISQGSSEHSICCAIPQSQAARAKGVLDAAFGRELAEGQIQNVDVTTDLAILAVVGDGMAGMPGVSGKVFGALGNAQINVRAIAQGASERNISVVVDGTHATRALRAAHASFYLSPHTLSIGVIGPGTVGSVLLDQLAGERERLAREFKIDLRVRGILRSRQMCLSDQSIGLSDWRHQLAQHSQPADLTRFIEHVRVDYLPHTVLIDCSADSQVARQYRDWLAAGIHIVTPNKRANSIELSYYESLKAARRESGAHYLYETTVGAGLPVIQTLRDLRETGDQITRIEGILSGTLAYLFNVYDGRTPFSAIVREAKQRGYTEPDPRDDLSGTDVARKLIILGREMGLKLEMSDVDIASLVPADLAAGSSEEFLAGLSRHDLPMRERYEQARARGHVLRYVGAVAADGRATVGLTELEQRHAFANIALTDNVVRFATARYCDNPLIVQGPGAGPAVTAGGVFADLLRLATYLGARL
ncbi:MAG TPA: bifunctional aspartate kinase/homoserine dehydrogenase I [Steroidobacteraceae bacterium]|jgi:aspartokinase/homoserine dehydrogenase 1|nr:bifunctional aspartate kinase/homoserine dehydrogenase I [Steroidobacteraceae bacterium]